jgi:hypothetical protein
MMKNDKDNYLLPLCHQDTKKGKNTKKCRRHTDYSSSSVSSSSLVASSSSSSSSGARVGPMPKATNSIGVSEHRDWGWVVRRHVRELKKWLIPLNVDNLLVALNYLKVQIHHIHVLIRVTAHGKDTPEHLQEVGVGATRGGGTTTAGRARRSHSWRRRSSVVSPRILGQCEVKRVMCDILIELLMCHHLNHPPNVGRISTRS